MLLRLVVYLSLALLCLLATSHWWLPPVLPKVAGLWSVEIAAVERVEGGRLRLSGLVLEPDSAAVQIDQIELPFEWIYLQERFFGQWSAASTVRLGGVQVFARKTSPAVEPQSKNVFLPKVLQQLSSGLDAAEPWLPRIELERFEYRDEARRIVALSSLAYQDRRLAAGGVLTPLPGEWQGAAEFGSKGIWKLEFSQDIWDLSGTLQVNGGARQVSLKGQIERGGSQLDYEASFGDSDWMPTTASVKSDGFDLTGIYELPTEDFSLMALELKQFQAEWDGGNYYFKAGGESLVRAAEQPEQTLAFDLSGEGNTNALQLTMATVDSEWAHLQLSDPLTVDFAKRNFVGQARLRAELDLGRQPWVEAEGHLEAALSLASASGDALRFDLSGRDLVYGGVAVRSLAAKGSVGFEKLSIDSLRLAPAEAGADEAVEIAGTVGFQSKSLELTGEALLGAEWVNSMIGQAILAQPLELTDGRVSGSWEAPTVEGTVRTSVQTEATETIGLSADLLWDGQQRLTWKGKASCDGAEIKMHVGILFEEAAYSIQLESLRWSDPERSELVLESPTQLHWLRSGKSLEERLSVSPFVLEGDAMKVAASYSPVEGMDLLLKNVSLARVNRWVKKDLPTYHVDLIQCGLTGFRPFLSGNFEIVVEERIEATAQARLELSAELGENTIQVKNVSLLFSEEEVLKGQLSLPLRLRLPFLQTEADDRQKPFYELAGGGLRGRLKGHSTPGFKEWLQLRSGLKLGEGNLDLDLAGDLDRPVGHVNLQVASVALDRDTGDQALPALRSLDLQLKVDEQAVDVDKLGFMLNESGLQASARIPMEALVEAVSAAEFEPVQLLQSVSGKIHLNDWQMENWVDWLPPIFRRSGSLSGTFNVEPALQLSGELRFKDFGLRPTSTLASVEQINGQIRLKDRLLRIDKAGALIGGSRVELAGEMNLTDWTQPQWFLELNGQNVPILRTTEMILRSDLDINVDARNPAQSPLVAGSLNLRSSTLLVDFDPLAPRLKKGSSTRPPFFRISEEPFAPWRFDLKASGERFMRVRSPYFRTKLSADVTLRGTFADPQLLGAVRTNDAELSFPGAKFVINEGEALIEASRPNEVQLAFNGIAQRASKVIVMDVSQTLQDPLIHFESTPPMSQADIVRLLATGSTTGGGVGNLGIYLGQGILGAGGMNESFADKLTVDVGEETSRSGRKTVDARYQLTPRWSLEGEYDVFDAYNADLIWTIFKR